MSSKTPTKSQHHWLMHIDACQQQGISMKAYAQQQGIELRALYDARVAWSRMA